MATAGCWASFRLKNAVTNDETTVMVQGLQDGIKRMQNIINEIVTISRIMNNQIDLSIGPINPGLIAERTLANMQESLKSRHVTIHFKREEWPDKMRGDGDLLALLISNLVSNAVKYTPDGGSVFISAVIEQESILMTVKDTGIGVDEDQQEQIFERFHTIGDPMLHSTSKTAFRGGGLGLGLAVCKGIVEAHGGSIEVESNGCDPETLPGSTFVVRLPLVSAFQRPNKL
ncbi:MAG: HAMP domain-containing sensor histidine kinase [Anaerolineae bacterium]